LVGDRGSTAQGGKRAEKGSGTEGEIGAPAVATARSGPVSPSLVRTTAGQDVAGAGGPPAPCPAEAVGRVPLRAVHPTTSGAGPRLGGAGARLQREGRRKLAPIMHPTLAHKYSGGEAGARRRLTKQKRGRGWWSRGAPTCARRRLVRQVAAGWPLRPPPPKLAGLPRSWHRLVENAFPAVCARVPHDGRRGQAQLALRASCQIAQAETRRLARADGCTLAAAPPP
jgi:hypothetical protein